MESGPARPASGRLAGVFRSLRPHQWSKNLVVFAAVGLSKHLFEPRPLLRALAAFVLFCGLSGTVYLLNDVADVERDRLHPLKRLRPIASGVVPVRMAALLAVVLGLLCLGASWMLGRGFFLCGPADLPHHQDRFRLRVLLESLEQIDEVRADDRVTAQPNARRLA